MAQRLIALILLLPLLAHAEDKRELINMPKMMQQHMLANMRDHLVTLDKALLLLSQEKFDEAAELVEQRLGMSSLDDHGAAHMAHVMPKAMRAIGTEMHRAASRFALTAQEEELQPSLSALQAVTGQCVSCHRQYRIH